MSENFNPSDLSDPDRQVFEFVNAVMSYSQRRIHTNELSIFEVIGALDLVRHTLWLTVTESAEEETMTQ